MMRRKERLSRHIAKKLDLFAYIFAQAVFFQFVLSERASETDKSIIFVCGYRLREAMKKDVYQWRRALHIPVLIVLQVIFIILFGIFVVYDPKSAGLKDSSEDSSAYVGYPSRLLNK